MHVCAPVSLWFTLMTFMSSPVLHVVVGRTGPAAPGREGGTPFIGPCLEPNVTAAKKVLRHEFKSEVVQNEFIVKFSGFYKEEARKNYIASALANFDQDSFEVSFFYYISWVFCSFKTSVFVAQVLPRNNPMAEYPSDFDVLLVSAFLSDKARSALSDHPLIKSITPQRKVTRTLKEDEEDDVGGEVFEQDLENDFYPPEEDNLEKPVVDEEVDDEGENVSEEEPKPCNHPNCPDQIPWTKGRRKLAYGKKKLSP